VFLLLRKDNDEVSAMAYVGPEEFKKAKDLMTEKEFKQYVKKNSNLMKKAENDAAIYYRNNR
jgi:hypothetical protein